MQTYEEHRAFVAKLNVIDDVFFQKMAEDKESCEEILRIILEKPDLVVLEETGSIVENGTYEIYVNTAVDDGTAISELMQYFRESTGEHQNFQRLCHRVKYFKESREGVGQMCQLVEEYAEEKAKKAVSETEITIAVNFLKNGASVDMVAKSVPSLSRTLIEELQKKLS